MNIDELRAEVELAIYHFNLKEIDEDEFTETILSLLRNKEQ